MYPIAQVAKQFQSVASIKEMDQHVSSFLSIYGGELTSGNIAVLDVLKQFSCTVKGVAWLKRETIASLAGVSLSTVERSLRLFKNIQIIKIYNSFRKGMNGGETKAFSYYAFQPFRAEDHFFIQEEEIDVAEDPTFFCQIENDVLVNEEKNEKSSVLAAPAEEGKLFKKALNKTQFKTHDDERIRAFEQDEQNDSKPCQNTDINTSASEGKEKDAEPTFNAFQQKVYNFALANHFTTKIARLFADQSANLACTERSSDKFVQAAFTALLARIENKKLPPVVSLSAYFLTTLTDSIERGRQQLESTFQKKLVAFRQKKAEEEVHLFRKQLGLV